MDSARWGQITAIFDDAAERPESERQAFLDAACGDDAELMAEVRKLLKGNSQGAPLLDEGLPGIARRIVGAEVETSPPQEVGPYRLIRELGAGGMGVVGLYERADTGRPVAIKFLRRAGTNAFWHEHFAREIKTLAKLRHAHIARLYDAGALPDGTPWFVMEYVEGKPFTEYCREQAQRAEEQLRLFRSVCEAVQYAHRQGVIHCDLKPSNILVEADGTPRLLDFGIARELNESGQRGEGSGDEVFYSEEYAAPEWKRDGDVGAYTDVYSLGVILYETLTGRRPDGDSPEKPSAPTGWRIGKRAWADLDALCRKALDRDAGARYGSVEALIRDINHYLNEEPLECRQGGVSYRAGKFVRRNARAVLAVSLVSALIVGLVFFFTVRLARARNAALAEAARTKRVERFLVDMFESGTPEAAYSKDLRALSLLDRGVKEVGILKSEPETQAELYESLGSIYDMLGNFPESDRLLFLALDKMKSALGPENPKVAEVMLRIGVLRGDQSQLKDAVSFVQAGLALAQRHATPDDLSVIEAKSALGRVTAQSGAFEKAIPILEPLVKLPPSGEEASYALADNLLVLGVCYDSVGRHETAEPVVRRALVLHRQLAGEFHPKTANDLFTLGEIKAALGQYGEAEKYYREAIRIMEGWYGRNHPDAATYYGVFARTLLLEGKSAEAEGLLRRVLEIQQRAYGSANVRVSVTLDSLGKIAVERGDLPAAQADFSRALEGARSLFGEENYITAVLRADLGDVRLRQGQYALADQDLRGAVGVLIAKLPPGDAHTALAEVSWGRSLLRQERYAEAEKQLAAGYEILAKQAHPPADRMLEARQDLASVYDALKEPDKAAKFR
ncbi:MAG: serine/threonine-protein kinase [Bryobacteraceae bacterium]